VAKIAVLIDQLFEDSEYARPAASFREAGHVLTTIGLETGKKVIGKRNEESVKIDLNIVDANQQEYDALFIPGGYSPDRLRIHEPVVSFVRDFVEAGKPVFMICHAPQLLISADVLRGRTVTGYASIRKDMENAGATVKDQPVVRDQNLISSRNPDDIPAFIDAALLMLD
jgi:protease I